MLQDPTENRLEKDSREWRPTVEEECVYSCVEYVRDERLNKKRRKRDARDERDNEITNFTRRSSFVVGIALRRRQ